MKNNIPKEGSQQKSALKLLAEALSALADASETAHEDDPWLDLAALRDYGFTRESLRSAAEKGLAVHRGPRGKILVRESDIDAWIKSRPWKPGPRKTPVRDLEEAHVATARALGVSR